jgi:hypothetical protein
MPLTRDERSVVEDLVRRVRNLEQRADDVDLALNGILEAIASLDSETNMSDWTQKQWSEFLKPYIKKYLDSGSALPPHDHTSDQQGGPAYADKGARLIDSQE